MDETREKSRISAVNIVFLVTMLVSVGMSFLPLNFLDEYPWVQLLLSQGILIAPVAVYMIREKMPYRETVQLKKIKFLDLLLTLVFGVLIQPVLTLINAISLVFSTNSTSNFLYELSLDLPLPVTLFLVALIPCVLEETVYRGFFYQEYKKADPWKAVLLSGFLFGLMHGNVNQFCYAAVMGIVFALLIEATGSILSTMLIHFAVNAFSVVMIYVYPYLFELLKWCHQEYQKMGMTEVAQMLEEAFGDMTISGHEWMAQMMNTPTELSLGLVLQTYLPSAVLCGVLAYWVFRTIATRTGNWERICGFVGKKKEDAPSLFTTPLKVAIAVGVVFMFVVELLYRLPR